MDHSSHAIHSLIFVSAPQFLISSFVCFCDRDRIHGLKGGCVRGADNDIYFLLLVFVLLLLSVVWGQYHSRDAGPGPVYINSCALLR